MLSLFGAGIGRGIAIGKAYVLRSGDIDIPHYEISAKDVPAEIKRFRKALQETESAYHQLIKNLPRSAPKESAAFIEAHTMMLRDPLLVNESIKIIRKQSVNAEYALQSQADNLIKVFEAMDDAYLKAKKNDVQHVTNRILRKLLGIVAHSLDEFTDDDLRGRIVVAQDLSPAETMFVEEHQVAAFVTDFGSQISHTAIVARSLKMPAVVGLHGSTKYISDDDLIIVDGMRGIIIVNPDTGVLKEFKTLQSKIRAREKYLATLTRRRSHTKDGQKIQLMANIETAKEIKQVKRSNAAGVGLYRTEYLFMNRDEAPSEQEQFKAYKRIIRGVQKPVVIRTLDIGG